MNRGNLAEDPRSGLSSSSRYSRNGGEKNSLLYVDSSSLRKERRAAFGGQIYQTAGSHGCVNMPYYAAEYIFNNADTGTPVVLY